MALSEDWIAEQIEGALDAAGAGKIDKALGMVTKLARRAQESDDASALADAYCAEAKIRWSVGDVEAAEARFRDAVATDPQLHEAALSLAELLADELEDHEAALDIVGEMLDAAEDPAAGIGPETQAFAHLQAGRSLAVLYEPEMSLDHHERAVELAPEEGEIRAALALARFDLWDFSGALEDARAAVKLDDQLAESWHTLSLILERTGDEAEAKQAAQRAQRLDPEGFPQPLEVDEERYRSVADEALAELPERIRKYLANVPIMVEDWPSEETCKLSDPPLSPGIVGRFDGTPLPYQSTGDVWSHVPASIQLYRRNMLRSITSQEQLREQVAHTLLHEIGHYLGLDEDDLYERGLE